MKTYYEVRIDKQKNKTLRQKTLGMKQSKAHPPSTAPV